MDAVILQSTLTCPHCGQRTTGTMPVDACTFFHACEGCGAMLRTAPRRLLRLLLVWRRAVSADPAATRLLPARRH